MMSVLLTILVVLGIVCFVTALLDIGMNGAAYAGWAPWGLGIAAICGVFVLIFGRWLVY